MNEMISVKSVKALPNYKLLLEFNTQEKKEFDVTPYLEKGVFSKLKDIENFNTAKTSHSTVTWLNGEIDLSPDTLYLKSIPI